MALTRNIPKADAFMKQGTWEKKSLEGREVTGKTLGIVGMGRVGSVEVASRALGLKMNVIAYDPFITGSSRRARASSWTDLDTLYARSDYITIHTPKSKETMGLIGKEAFAV
jgi:D-3-phosphoglycerate dehydrogenase